MSNTLRWSALVMLDKPELPEFNAIANYVAEYFEDTSPLKAAGSTEALITFTVGDYTLAVTLIDRPVPWTQLEGPCHTAWFWPDAEQSLKKHPAHLLIALVDEGSNSIEKSTLLTQVVAAIVENSPTCGIFWGPGRLVHPPRAFVDQALQLTAEDLPLFLWVDFRVEVIDQQSVRLYTTGLEALGFTELEIPEFAGEPQHMLEYAYNIAHYQITQSKPINDGDTMGLTDELQAVAHRRGSMFDENMEVIALEFQTPGE